MNSANEKPMSAGSEAPMPGPHSATASGVESSLAIAGHAVGERRWLIWILVFAVAVRIVTLGAYPLMDNTEARYAEIARKMVETGDWVMPQVKYGVPFWSKPPLSIWLTSVTYLGFGVNEFAARLSSLIACLAVVWLTVKLAAQREVPGLGFKAAVVLFTTPLVFISAGAVMTDPALALGTTLSMAGFWQAMTRSGRAGRVWGYLFFVGLAIGLLAKGPVGPALTLVPVGLWTLWKGGIRNVWQRLPWISGFVLAAALSVPWYVVAESRTPGFLDYFIIGENWKRYTEAGWKGDMFGTAHARPRGMIWPLAVAATLPWCVVWLGMLWQMRRQRMSSLVGPADDWRAYLWLWMLTSPVFFTFAGNILFTYVLPGLPAFALLVAEAWSTAGDENGRGVSTKISGLAIPVLIMLGVLFVLPRVAPDHSHKALVAQYASQRDSNAQQLVYLATAPLSAEFYARGQLAIAASAADLGRFLSDGHRNFYVLTQSQLDALPDLRGRLAPVSRSGKYVLLRDSQQPATPAQ
jgi:4-amino-4-deoxy-L-arabinose transferase-like glycosyltransferase